MRSDVLELIRTAVANPEYRVYILIYKLYDPEAEDKGIITHKKNTK